MSLSMEGGKALCPKLQTHIRFAGWMKNRLTSTQWTTNDENLSPWKEAGQSVGTKVRVSMDQRQGNRLIGSVKF